MNCDTLQLNTVQNYDCIKVYSIGPCKEKTMSKFNKLDHFRQMKNMFNINRTVYLTEEERHLEVKLYVDVQYVFYFIT